MIRSRSLTKHKKSVLRPNKHVRLSFGEYQALKLTKWAGQNYRCGNEKCQVFITDPNFGELHHVRFRSQGGQDSEDNTILLCPRCHRLHHGIGEKVVPKK